MSAVGGSTHLLSRRIYAWFVQKRSKVLQRLMDEMVAIVEASDMQEGQERIGDGSQGLIEG